METGRNRTWRCRLFVCARNACVSAARFVGSSAYEVGLRACADGSRAQADGSRAQVDGLRARAEEMRACAVSLRAEAEVTSACARGSAAQAEVMRGCAVGPRAQAEEIRACADGSRGCAEEMSACADGLRACADGLRGRAALTSNCADGSTPLHLGASTWIVGPTASDEERPARLTHPERAEAQTCRVITLFSNASSWIRSKLVSRSGGVADSRGWTGRSGEREVWGTDLPAHVSRSEVRPEAPSTRSPSLSRPPALSVQFRSEDPKGKTSGRVSVAC